MQFHGQNFIGSDLSAASGVLINAFDPRNGKKLDHAFHEATAEEIDRALALGVEAFPILRKSSPEQLAGLLQAIASEIEKLGDGLIETASMESGLGKDRLTGERGRTVNQLRLFATVVE